MAKDLTNLKFGKLTVIREVERGKSNLRQWLCKCDCGNEKIVYQCSLLSGGTKSCGCSNKIRKSLGLSTSRLYKCYYSIKIRCFNKNCEAYKNYGGRGITMCDEWKSDFKNFYNWAIANGYADHLTIDRIDNNGNYEPSNCRWATHIEQDRNKRTNRNITFNGETHCLKDWAKITGIHYSTLKMRFNIYKWSIEDCLTTPVVLGGTKKNIGGY